MTAKMNWGQLLASLNEQERPLAKILILCINEGININYFLEDDEKGRIIVKESLVGSYNTIVKKLIAGKILKYDYENSLTARHVLAKPLLIITEPITDSFIAEFRQFFSAKMTGSAHTISTSEAVTNAMNTWIEKNGQYTKQQILEATEKYIEDCIKVSRPVKQAHRFIDDGTVSSLSVWLEQTVENNIEEDPFGEYF